jgi:hypothetical protein
VTRRLTLAAATAVVLLASAAGAHAWPNPCVQVGHGPKGVHVCAELDPLFPCDLPEYPRC